ncbi:MAG: polymer-forming cytoskeletal protein [Melioribacter sp.]|nr:polymer-forming cytoskeletal protein [Melioribacter sp.]
MASKKDSLAEDVSIISNSVKIDGNLFSEGNVRIDGTIYGSVSVNGNLTVGEGSEIQGEVKAKNITMSGKVLGKVTAQEKIKLESKCVLKGDLITKFLVIDEGAYFEGYSHMNNTGSLNNTEG